MYFFFKALFEATPVAMAARSQHEADHSTRPMSIWCLLTIATPEARAVMQQSEAQHSTSDAKEKSLQKIAYT